MAARASSTAAAIAESVKDTTDYELTSLFDNYDERVFGLTQEELAHEHLLQGFVPGQRYRFDTVEEYDAAIAALGHLEPWEREKVAEAHDYYRTASMVGDLEEMSRRDAAAKLFPREFAR